MAAAIHGDEGPFTASAGVVGSQVLSAQLGSLSGILFGSQSVFDPVGDHHKEANFLCTTNDVQPLNAPILGTTAIFSIPHTGSLLLESDLQFDLQVAQSDNGADTYTGLVGAAAFAAINEIRLIAGGNLFARITGDEMYHIYLNLAEHDSATAKALHDQTGLFYGAAGLDDAGITAYNWAVLRRKVPLVANADNFIPLDAASESNQRYASRGTLHGGHVTAGGPLGGGAFLPGIVSRHYVIPLKYLYWALHPGQALPISALSAEIRMEVQFNDQSQVLFTNRPATATVTLANVNLHQWIVNLSAAKTQSFQVRVNHGEGLMKKGFELESQKDIIIPVAGGRQTSFTIQLPNLRSPAFMTLVVVRDLLLSTQANLRVPFLYESVDRMRVEANSGLIYPETCFDDIQHTVCTKFLPVGAIGQIVAPWCTSVTQSLTGCYGSMDFGNLHNPTITIQKDAYIKPATSILPDSPKINGLNIDPTCAPGDPFSAGDGNNSTLRQKTVCVYNFCHQWWQEKNGTIVKALY